MFERFTGHARRVVVLSQEEAQLLNHGYIGTEHILLGLVAAGESVAAEALADRGVTLDGTRSEVEEIVGPRGAEPRTEAIPFTPRAKKVLELALREALSLGDDHIGAEHILLAVIREREGVAVRVLNRLGVDLDEIRHPLIDALRDARIAAESRRLSRRHSSRGGTARTAEPILRCPGCDFEVTLVGAPNELHVRIERTDDRPEFRMYLSSCDISEELVHECEPDSAPALPTDEIRINQQIRARRVRLIGSDGTQYGVVTLADALRLAREQGLDLIEVAGSSAYAPVCKIMDYDTYKHERDQRGGQSGE